MLKDLLTRAIGSPPASRLSLAVELCAGTGRNIVTLSSWFKCIHGIDMVSGHVKLYKTFPGFQSGTKVEGHAKAIQKFNWDFID